VGAEAEAKPGLEVGPAVPEWRSRGVLYDRERAAQRTAVQLQRRSIVAAPGRASPRLGADSCNRELCSPGGATSLRARPGRLESGPDGPPDGWERRES